MTVLFFMNLLVLASSFLVVYRLLRLKNIIDGLIAWVLVYFSQIILTELALGIAGILYLNNLVLLNLAVLIFVWLFAKSCPSTFGVAGIREEISRLLENKVILFLSCVILCFGLAKICVNLINPTFGWDCLNYHFTYPVEWLKHGNLNMPITVSDDPSPAYYPINGSLYFLWLMLPLKNVMLADLGQVPFFIISFFAVFSIARKLRLSKEYSIYAAGLFFIIPNFFKQLQFAYVDVIVCALFLACVNFLLSLDEDFSLANLLGFCISAGLFLGTKSVALPYLALLLIPFVFLLLRNLGRLHYLIPGAVIVFLLGGFSYARNFMQTGDPLYPLNFSLLGKIIFKGVEDKSMYSVHFKSSDYSLAQMLFHEGLGAQSLLLVLPAVFIGPFLSFKRRMSLSFAVKYLLVLPMLMYLAYRFAVCVPNPRYIYALFAIGMISAFFMIGIFKVPKAVVNILVLVCAIASMSELAKRQELAFSIIATFLLFIALLFGLKSLRLARIRGLTALLLMIIFAGGLVILNRDYNKNEYSRYLKMVKYSGFWPDAVKAWQWLNNNTEGNSIAYVGRPVPFPLYGTKFKNNVYYVSVNKTEPAKLHYFKDSFYKWGADFESKHRSFEEKGNYRSEADYSAWLANLKKRNIDYLFIYSLHQIKGIEFPFEDSWAAEHPEKFVPAFMNQAVHIYRVIK